MGTACGFTSRSMLINRERISLRTTSISVPITSKSDFLRSLWTDSIKRFWFSVNILSKDFSWFFLNKTSLVLPEINAFLDREKICCCQASKQGNIKTVQVNFPDVNTTGLMLILHTTNDILFTVETRKTRKGCWRFVSEEKEDYRVDIIDSLGYDLYTGLCLSWVLLLQEDNNRMQMESRLLSLIYGIKLSWCWTDTRDTLQTDKQENEHRDWTRGIMCLRQRRSLSSLPAEDHVEDELKAFSS